MLIEASPKSGLEICYRKLILILTAGFNYQIYFFISYRNKIKLNLLLSDDKHLYFIFNHLLKYIMHIEH